MTIDASGFPLDSANAEQAGAWDGEDGEYWAAHHQSYERLLGVFDSTLVDAAGVRCDERCLDIGCGTGATARALAVRAVDGSVLGVDLSRPMLDIARTSAERASLSRVEFVQGDAQVYPFDASSVDVAVSRMGCMFFGDPAAAFANVGRALRPGGRLALVVWQRIAVNGWYTAIDKALGAAPPEDEADQPTAYSPGPFSLADPGLCELLLREAGFVDVTVEGLHLPLAFGTVEEAEDFLQTWIDEDQDDAERGRATAALRRLLADHSTADGVFLPSAAWLATARRPGHP